jgi:hypothetical protein
MAVSGFIVRYKMNYVDVAIEPVEEDSKQQKSYTEVY